MDELGLDDLEGVFDLDSLLNDDTPPQTAKEQPPAEEKPKRGRRKKEETTPEPASEPDELDLLMSSSSGEEKEVTVQKVSITKRDTLPFTGETIHLTVVVPQEKLGQFYSALGELF